MENNKFFDELVDLIFDEMLDFEPGISYSEGIDIIMKEFDSYKTLKEQYNIDMEDYKIKEHIRYEFDQDYWFDSGYHL